MRPFAADLQIVPISGGRLGGVERSTQQYMSGFGEKLEVSLTMWAVLGSERVVVVDCAAGAPATVERLQGRELLAYLDPLATVRQSGIEPEDVDVLVISHLHWDHCLGLYEDLFPTAEIWIQRAELEYAATPLPVHARLFDRALLHRLERSDDALGARVHMVDGDCEVAPGISLIATPGHTPGLASVLVATSAGVHAIASDNVPFASSVTGTPETWVPNGIHVRLDECYASLRRLAREADVVLPSHDAVVFDHAVYPVGHA